MDGHDSNHRSDQDKRPSKGPKPGKKPPPHQRVIVITRTYRCLGYLDDHGHWRDDARGQIIPEVTGWVNLDDFRGGAAPSQARPRG